MRLKKIQNADLKGKNVLVRTDFNVPFEKGKIKETYKIETAKKTIEYIMAKGGKVTLVSHLGRPLAFYKENSGSEWAKEFSLQKILLEIKKVFDYDLKFIPSCDSTVIKKYQEEFSEIYDLFILENIRFYKKEENNDEGFAEDLSRNFDIFVNEAFSVCHREHASVVGIAKKLPSFAGFQLQKEVKNLERVKKYPEHPAVAIIGGAKIETKLPLIEELSENYDFILVGGKIANEAIDQEINFKTKVILPVDFADKNRFDIGPHTIKEFSKIIKQAETIIWNGPMGMFEKKPFDRGTREIMKAVAESGAFSVVGGGESVQAVHEAGFMDNISFISTGGGAMLEFLSGGEMPGLEVLKDTGE